MVSFALFAVYGWEYNEKTRKEKQRMQKIAIEKIYQSRPLIEEQTQRQQTTSISVTWSQALSQVVSILIHSQLVSLSVSQPASQPASLTVSSQLKPKQSVNQSQPENIHTDSDVTDLTGLQIMPWHSVATYLHFILVYNCVWPVYRIVIFCKKIKKS